jgi:guanine deaminase
LKGKAESKQEWMRAAIRLSFQAMRRDLGGPFGAVIVRRGKLIARGGNQVISSKDPTAHAEIVAIRRACKRLHRFDLSDCELFTSCEPCPMCLAAIYWSRIRNLYYANTRRDAAAIAFDDDFIYREVARPLAKRSLPMKQILRKEAIVVFNEWRRKADKVRY